MPDNSESPDLPSAEPSEAQARLLRLEQSCNELLGSHAVGRAESLPAQQLQRLLEISRSMNQIHDRDELLSYVRDRLRELFDAENSFVIMLDAGRGPRIQSTNLHSMDVSGKFEDGELPISETILNQVVSTRQALLIDNTADAPELRDQRSVLRYKIASVLCAPLIVDDCVIGVLHFDQRGSPSPFSSDDLRLLSLFAEHAATAFRNLELIERLHQTVAEIQSVQAAVVRAERLSALGEMAAGIAHDFNNTLLIALGMCDLLLARDGFDPEARKSIDTIRTCALDAANTVRRLLNFTRESTEQRPAESVRLDKVVEELPLFTRHKWSDEALKRGAVIKVVLNIESAEHALATPSEIREILMNLIFNAADAIEEQGTITLSAGARGNEAFIAVEDDGVGMDGTTRERAFNPFFSTKGARGCGFGLSTCEGMATRLGGRIDCTTEVGRGSRLTLWLPLADEPADAREQVRAPSKSNFKLLVVDDDELVLHTLERLLTTLGHDVTALTDPTQALDRLQGDDFDAVLTDLGMPGLSGTDLARQIQESGLELPVMLLTGWNPEVDPSSSKVDGVRHVLSKPVTLDSLKQALTAIFEPQ